MRHNSRGNHVDNGREIYFPPNVITLILAKLNIKSMAKCACISNAWRHASQPIIAETKAKLEHAWMHGLNEPTDVADIEENDFYRVKDVQKKDNLIAVGGTGILKFWDVEMTEATIDCQDLGPRTFYTICFFGGNLFSGDDAGMISAFDLNNGNFLFEVEAHPVVCTIIKIGDLLASGGDDSSIKIWRKSKRRRKMKCKILRGHTGTVLCLHSSIGGNLIVSGSTDNTFRTWDVSSGLCLNVFRGCEDIVWGVQFFDGNKILSGSSHGNRLLRIWGISSEEVKGSLSSQNSLITSYDGSNGLIFVGYDDGKVRMWADFDSENCLREFRVGAPVWSVRAEKDELMVVVEPGQIMIWDLSVEL